MRKNEVASIVKTVVDNIIPEEVSLWIREDCPIMVDDLSTWDIKPVRKSIEGKVLLGVFGLEDGKPVIGINHKTLNTTNEVVKTTRHEIAHAYLWHAKLPNGERAARKLAIEWEEMI